MQKILATALAASLLLFSLPAHAQTLPGAQVPGTEFNESIKPVTVHVDGKYIPSDVAPQIVNGRTFVPLRAVSTALGADVRWNGSAQTVTISNTQGTTIFTIASHTYVAAGVSKTLDAPAFIKNGRTLVPLRAAAESFGLDVNWSQQTADVSLNTGAPLVKPNFPADTPNHVKWLIDKYYVESGDGIVGSYVFKESTERPNFYGHGGYDNDGIYRYLFISNLADNKYQIIEIFTYGKTVFISSKGFEQPLSHTEIDVVSGTGYQQGADYVFNSGHPIYFLSLPHGGPDETRLTFKANDQDLILLQTIYWPGHPHFESIGTSYNQFTRF